MLAGMSAHGSLSPQQFHALYPPGRTHSIPVEHLEQLRDSDGRPRTGKRLEGVQRGIVKEGGIKNPLVVVDSPHGHEPSLVEGHHRHDAAKALGMTHVPVAVVDSYSKVNGVPRHPDTDRIYDEAWNAGAESKERRP
jgi:hypothetical protein